MPITAENAQRAPMTNPNPPLNGHPAGATRLSQQAGWPHRPEDWALTRRYRKGSSQSRGRVVGTALCTSSVSRIEYDHRRRKMRGQGLGAADERDHRHRRRREMRLVATGTGCRSTASWAFEPGDCQHQGILRASRPDGPPRRTDPEGPAGGDGSAASGLARGRFYACLARRGAHGQRGFAMLRSFGRGMCWGRVAAEATRRAPDLTAAARLTGEFLRVDLPAIAASSPSSKPAGSQSGGRRHGHAPQDRPAAAAPEGFKTYALASQALG